MKKEVLAFFEEIIISILIIIIGICAINQDFFSKNQKDISEENEKILVLVTPEPQVTSFVDQSRRKEELTSREDNHRNLEDNVSTDSLIEDDFFKLLCLITYAESGLEEEIGQISVAATILNRIENPNFPNSLKEVIEYPGAFSSVHNGDIYIMCDEPYLLGYEDVPEVTKEAVRRAINGEDPTEQLLREEAWRLGLSEDEFSEGGALFFYNPRACGKSALQERECIKVQVKIGNHNFYKVWG